MHQTPQPTLFFDSEFYTAQFDTSQFEFLHELAVCQSFKKDWTSDLGI
jgi:hypothetical protein